MSVSSRINDGLWAWKQPENNNRMIAFQAGKPERTAGEIELAYFGCSSFRITTPEGLTVLIDPWRNPPWGNWDWFLYDFPALQVDVAVSTHAHFDHDGLHAVSANVLLDRLVGTYAFADIKITGIADKHVTDSSHNVYDWAEMTRRLTNMITDPPNNCRSFDNSIILLEVAGLKILHWGDNRPYPPDAVWDMIGRVDIALLPIDGSQHVLSYAQVDKVIGKLQPHIVVPHHYYTWDVMTRGSTLLPPDEWVKSRPDQRWLDEGSVKLPTDYVKAQHGKVICFGGNVAFAKPSTKADKVGA
jgi:L-ascorbate metabolism protein UlaG (beta-lactamase superfamily)